MHVCRRRSRCSEVCGCRRVDRFVRDSLIRSLAFPCRKKKSVSVVETNSLSLSFVLSIIKQPHHSLTLLLLKSKLPLFFFSFVLVRLASPFPFRFFIPSAFWLEVGTLFGCAFRKKKIREKFGDARRRYRLRQHYLIGWITAFLFTLHESDRTPL